MEETRQSTIEARTALRLVAVAGIGFVLITRAISSFPLKPRQLDGFGLLFVAVLAVAAALWLLLPEEAGKIRCHPDLLVPLGLTVLASAILSWLALVPAFGALLLPSWELKLGTLAFSISVFLVLYVALYVAYGAWVTTMIVELQRRNVSDPVGAVRSARRFFWWTLGVETIGIGVVFLVTALAVAVAAASMPLALLLIGVASVLWNFATSAILLTALSTDGSFGNAIAEGVFRSWQLKKQIWKPVAAQLLLLGLITFVHVNYVEQGSAARPGPLAVQDKTNWTANAFWTGGYEDECRWYGAYVDALHTTPVELISLALGLVFAVLAICVKLRIATFVVAMAANPSEPTVGQFAKV